jgi:uncharacterized protein YjbJ (UPF0337 family)
MGLPNDEEVKGGFDKFKGKVKETIGVATDNERLEAEGEADQVEGSVQKGFGKARREVGEVISDIGDKLRR